MKRGLKREEIAEAAELAHDFLRYIYSITDTPTDQEKEMIRMAKRVEKNMDRAIESQNYQEAMA